MYVYARYGIQSGNDELKNRLKDKHTRALAHSRTPHAYRLLMVFRLLVVHYFCACFNFFSNDLNGRV